MKARQLKGCRFMLLLADNNFICCCNNSLSEARIVARSIPLRMDRSGSTFDLVHLLNLSRITLLLRFVTSRMAMLTARRHLQCPCYVYVH